MADINARIQHTAEEMMGNEALLQMLETEAATEMLDWGISTAKAFISKTQDLDDFAADLALVPRLKVVRQSMRSIGNWATGKYVDPASRVQLQAKRLEYCQVIFGEDSQLPAAEKADEVLNQVDDPENTPQQLILKLKELIEKPG